jgi:hypothetical protein
MRETTMKTQQGKRKIIREGQCDIPNTKQEME